MVDMIGIAEPWNDSGWLTNVYQMLAGSGSLLDFVILMYCPFPSLSMHLTGGQAMVATVMGNF